MFLLGNLKSSFLLSTFMVAKGLFYRAEEQRSIVKINFLEWIYFFAKSNCSISTNGCHLEQLLTDCSGMSAGLKGPFR